MAIMSQGVFGALSGKIGNLIGSSWKGISVLKTKPASVSNPKTAGQVAQRTKFAFAVAFAQLILSVIIKPLYDRFSVQQSGFNAWLAANIDLFADALPAPRANLVISSGKMEATSLLTAVADVSDNRITVTWANDTGSGFKLASDKLYLVAVNFTKSIVHCIGEAAARSATTYAWTIPSGTTANDEFQVYAAFRRTDGTIVSNTSTKACVAQA